MKCNPKYNGRYVEGAGGVRLFVEENGEPTNPTILWIHGICQCRLSWDHQFENCEPDLITVQGILEGLTAKKHRASCSYVPQWALAYTIPKKSENTSKRATWTACEL